MTTPMYKSGVEMLVTDDPDSRALLARHGWAEKAPKKKQAAAKKVVIDDNDSK